MDSWSQDLCDGHTVHTYGPQYKCTHVFTQVRAIYIRACLCHRSIYSSWREHWFRKTGHLPIAGFAPRHAQTGIIQESSASAVGNSVTCRPVAQHRTRCFPSNRQAGIYNPTTGHRAMGTIIRETLRRPGPHPHRSVRTSFNPTAIFMHHIDLIRSVTGKSISNRFNRKHSHVQKHAHQSGI